MCHKKQACVAILIRYIQAKVGLHLLIQIFWTGKLLKSSYTKNILLSNDFLCHRYQERLSCVVVSSLSPFCCHSDKICFLRLIRSFIKLRPCLHLIQHIYEEAQRQRCLNLVYLRALLPVGAMMRESRLFKVAWLVSIWLGLKSVYSGKRALSRTWSFCLLFLHNSIMLVYETPKKQSLFERLVWQCHTQSSMGVEGDYTNFRRSKYTSTHMQERRYSPIRWTATT